MLWPFKLFSETNIPRNFYDLQVTFVLKKILQKFCFGNFSQSNNVHLHSQTVHYSLRCGVFGDNAKAFRTSGAVSKVVKYLYIEDIPLQEATVRALYQLSRDPANCAIIHKHGGVKVGCLVV